MPVDLARLQAMATFTDPAIGISERFVDVPLQSGSTVGVLSLPLEVHGSTGWVITHSFGPEQPNLSALDVGIARQLAANGSPVLRFHCQGYGDSEHDGYTPSVESHIQDTVDATRALRDLSGVRSMGLIGAKFGGSSALLAGTQVAADHLVLIAPAVRGGRFLRELVRAGAIIELTKTARPGDTEDAWTVLKGGGSISIRGSVITGDHYRTFDGLDLRTVHGFAGSVLLVQVSTGTQPRRDMAELAERLEGQGATVTTTIVTDRSAPVFGERHYRPAPGDLLGDIASELHLKISGTVAEWCVDRPSEPKQEGERSEP
jgi:hypothetical protein